MTTSSSRDRRQGPRSDTSTPVDSTGAALTTPRMRSARSAVGGAARRVRRLLPEGRGRIPGDSMAALPLAARAKVRVMQVWKAAPLTRPTYFSLRPAHRCRLVAHTDTMVIDVVTMDYVFRRDLFPVTLAGRVAVDIGAHKGYFGALALTEGAAAVYSFEPESSNFEAMRRAEVAASERWARRRLAVGAADGEVVLNVSTESWSHSVHSPASGDLHHTEQVPMIAFGNVLAEIALEHPGTSVLLKLNVEGAAGDCLLSVAPSELRLFDELLIDLESNTPQGLDAVTDHIEAAGFAFVAERERVFHFTRGDTSQ